MCLLWLVDLLALDTNRTPAQEALLVDTTPTNPSTKRWIEAKVSQPRQMARCDSPVPGR